MAIRRNGGTRAWRATKARILAASDICWLCGRPGADSVDHVVPVTAGGTEADSNLRPAHHDVEPKCNRVKGGKDYSRTRIIRTSKDW